MNETKPTRLIVGITGATGTIFGARLLQMLHGSGIETHMVMSKWGARTLIHETDYTVEQVQNLATHNYPLGDQGAAISSGSFITLGMVIVPCSMRSLAAIANGFADNLVHRAADVILKERRKLILVVRESPFNDIHLENMLRLARAGAHIIPASPGFYHRPQTIEGLVDHLVFRILDHLGIPHSEQTRWKGIPKQDQELVAAKEE